jgi:hypothetical protein
LLLAQALRQKISNVAPQLNTSLANWWNVYDAFNVWRTYRVGDIMPDLDNATYAQVSRRPQVVVVVHSVDTSASKRGHTQVYLATPHPGARACP